MTMDQGSQDQLVQHTVQPADASSKNVEWRSGDAAIAVVNSDDRATAVAAGRTNVTVTTQGGHQAGCEVTVVVPVTGVTLDKNSAAIVVGEQNKLTATVLPSNATNKNHTWSSNNSAVATVTNNGLVTGMAPGTARITVSTIDGNHTAFCDMAVIAPVTGVSLGKTTLAIHSGDSETLAVTVYPAHATNKSVTWSSNNNAVATVSSDGVVTGVAVGRATITVTTQDGGFQANCTVAVEASVYVAVWPLGLLKNGVSQPGYGYCSSVFVSGNDVYAAGDAWNGSAWVATHWKNGVPQHYSLSGGTGSYAHSVFVSGNDVYVAGAEYEYNSTSQTNTNYVAKLWKNGAEQRLNPTNGFRAERANSVFVSGNDVYVVGRETDGQSYYGVIWKNGAVLRRGSSYSVFVDGGDVYSAGGGVYKNGEHLFLDTSGFNSYATLSIFVSGGDWYVSGFVVDAQDRRYVTLWKNGVRQILSSSGRDSAVGASVFVFGSDVYVAGTERSGEIYTAKLWKNGVEQAYGNGENGEGLFVIVK